MTKYTKKQRKEIAEQFKAAKTVLAKNKAEVRMRLGAGRVYEEYICHALERCGYRWCFAREVVHQRIAPYSSLETWVTVNVTNYEYVTEDDMQAYRHRWLDALIEEFSN